MNNPYTPLVKYIMDKHGNPAQSPGLGRMGIDDVGFFPDKQPKKI